MKKHGFKKLIAGLSAACVMGSALPMMSFAAEGEFSKILGDSNGDSVVELADAILIMQGLANPNKYGKNGTDPHCFTEQGWINADVNGELGITTDDALTIQLYLLGKGKLTPRSGSEDPIAEATKIHLKNTSIEVEGENATVEGTTVTITHSGEFYIDGTLDDGQINVNIPDEKADAETVKIFLNGANITGKSAPAIFVNNAENTSINIVDGTTNTISDGDTAYSGDFAKKALIEAKDDITIKGGEKGDGVLEITANVQDALSCNNDIKFNGGEVKISTLNSTDKNDAVNAKGSITVKSGKIKSEAEGDGIKSSKNDVSFAGGNTKIKAGKDAVQAKTDINVSGGKLIAGGDKGLTAEAAINITGGTVIATATDNQVDDKLLAGTTQTTVLLNCIANPENEKDGTWNKDNALVAGDVDAKYQKKYKYVLFSDTSINGAKSCGFKNLATGASVTHTDGKQTQFQLSLVTVFDNVDPAGIASTTAEPSPAPGELTITLSDDGITTNATTEAKAEDNVCTISEPGVFTLTGRMTGGQIVVDVDKTVYPDGVVELVLSGMSLTNTETSPVYVSSVADEVVFTAKKGTENTISDGTDYTNADGGQGAIYAKDDIKFKGKGKLTVNGNAADGIVCKDDIKIYNGTLTVNAADDGIRAKDSVIIGSASDGEENDYSALSVTVKTKGGDGIKATSDTASSTEKQTGLVAINGGAVDIDSYADGISAEQYFVMNGGDLNIRTYEGSSYGGSTTSSEGSTGGWGSRPSGNPGGPGMDGNANKTDISAKGIKVVGLYDEDGTTWQSAGDITVSGGTITIDSSDDCMHGSGNVSLTGGSIKLASADDAVHADHDLTIGTKNSGSYDDVVIFVEKCYEGMEALKIYQNSGSVIVNSTDDGFNAAGGDGSGSANPGMPWGQGGFGGGRPGGGFSSGNPDDYIIQFNGGFALVNASNGDHDGFDCNGNIEINGGYIVSNGNEPYDCGDGGSTIKVNGGVWVSNCPSGGMSMSAGEMPASVSATANVSANTRLSLVGSDGNVIVSFIVDKAVSQLKAGGSGVSGASFYTGGELSGSAYFQELDSTQPAAYGGKLTGGTKV